MAARDVHTESLWRRARAWFIGVPAPDPVAQRHAPSVLVLCALGAVALVVGELVRFLGEGLVASDVAVSVLRLIGAVVLAVAFFVVRKGRFKQGVTLFLAGAVAISAAGVALVGFAANSGNLTELTMPLALAALLLGRRALWLSMAAYAVGFAVGGLRDAGYLWGSGPQPAPTLPFGAVGTAIIGFTVVSIVLDRVGLSLREGFDLALGRQRELERAGAELFDVNETLRAEMARRQNAEAKLIEAQKMEAVSRLSGGVAHDFNNLLTVILGWVELTRPTLSPEHPANEGLEQIRVAADRAADLTRQLLAFARRQLVAPQVLLVDDNLRSTERMLSRLLTENIQLLVQANAAEWTVLIDPGQLDQVIVNFVVNARDAMPSGGTLAIRTRQVSLDAEKSSASFTIPRGDYVVLEVSDGGTGMDADTRARIFEPFFTTKGDNNGTGLGLATCYGIVMQAGGGIFFETEMGKGTSFEVFLPRTARAGNLAPKTEGAATSSARGETILVVEDEAGVRAVTVRILLSGGYRVLQAAGLTEASTLVEGELERLDLLITDLVLPDGNGHEVARRVVAARPETPVLYVSGYTDDPALRRDISESEVDFLGKPFLRSQLLARVRELLDRNAERHPGAAAEPSSEAR